MMFFPELGTKNAEKSKTFVILDFSVFFVSYLRVILLRNSFVRSFFG